MKSLSGLTFGDIAFEVCSAFHRANISAVLVGGGAAAFYAPEAYETSDLDFVLHRELFGMPRASIIEELDSHQRRHPARTSTRRFLTLWRCCEGR